MKAAHRDVLSRALAAVLGGYALGNALPVALVAVFSAFAPVARSDAVLIAMQLSFVVYTGAVMWAFAARSALAAWLGIGVPALLAGLVAWVALL